MLSPRPWKLDQVAWLFAAFFAAMMLGVLVVQGYSSALSKEETKAPVGLLVMLGGTAMYQGVTLVLIGIFLRIHQVKWSDAFGFKKRISRSVSLAILTGAIVLPITSALGWVSRVVLESLGGHADLQESVKALQTAQSPGQKVYFAIVTVLLAPVMEELLFRGILYPAIKQFGFPKFALWFTSIFFAAFHANRMVFLPLLFMALVLTLLYETTENLVAPIVTHAMFNAANFVMVLKQMSS